MTPTVPRRPCRVGGAIALAASLLVAGPAEARITRIEITSREAPAFEGRTFAGAGAYEKLRGKAYGEIDPADPRHALIADLERAPRGPNGRVFYSMDIVILKPIDLGRGNRRLFVDINNRGSMRWERLNDGGHSNNPVSAADAGTGFLMNLGYAIVGNGWDAGATSEGSRLTITVPVARQADGTNITGPSYEYINFDHARGTAYTLTYPAASRDTSKATLTVRARLDERPIKVAPDAWEYVDEQTIRLLPAGTPFKTSHIYELTYTAKDPVVAGLGLAATRDFVSFLRHQAKDDAGTANPLSGAIDYTYSFAVSQSARYINDFQTFGFNEDENGRRVLDGVLNWIGGASGGNINYRFAQTNRTERNRQHHLYPEAVFPFAYPVTTDHLSGRTGGRIARCAATGTCPKAFEVNSANEYWVKSASLLHTNTQGRDLADPANVRFYLLSGLQHGTGNYRERGVCQQLTNGVDAEPALRALLVALDQWVSRGVEPPPSAVPRRHDGTAALAVPRPGFQTARVPQEALGWPAIPGVAYSGLISARYHLDFGPQFESRGILSTFPPSLEGRPSYTQFVSKVDEDGNEIAGVRLPAVAAPTGTTTGWALRRAGFGEGDGCEAAGQYIPFARTKTERLASGDPRRSLEERYEDHDGYVRAVTAAARGLEARRLLLAEDLRLYVAEAQASPVLAPAPRRSSR
jgi:hypothetical protein